MGVRTKKGRLAIGLVGAGIVAGVVLVAKNRDHVDTLPSVGLQSLLEPRLILDSGGQGLIIRTRVPLSPDGFNPKELWYVRVIECVESPCDSPQLLWDIDLEDAALKPALWNVPTGSDSAEIQVAYGVTPEGGALRAGPKNLEQGHCYLVSIRIDDRAAKALFVLENGRLSYSKYNTVPRSLEECLQAARRMAP